MRTSSTSRTTQLVGIFLAFLFCPACGKKLDRPTAVQLTANKSLGSVWIAMDIYPESSRDFYEQLQRDGIIDCHVSFTLGCGPGITGRNSYQLEWDLGEMRFVAGQLIVGDVTGVSAGDSNSAIAAVTIKLQPVGLYSRYQAAFDALRSAGHARFSNEGNRIGQTLEAQFRRYDDGWRLENIGGVTTFGPTIAEPQPGGKLEQIGTVSQ